MTDENDHALKDLAEPVNIYIHDPIAKRFVRVLKNTSFTPNQVTYLSVLVGFVSGYSFSQGTWVSSIAGGILLELTLILDCVDGQLARAKNMASDWGRLIDGIAGYFAYLAVVYGTAKATDSEVLVVSVVDMSAAEKAEAELDVQVLLDTNGCLGCHALDAKLLGPSFKAIAVKYKSDVQAQAMLARSIQQGGVGKWGQIPMPPIAGLSDKQAEALAAFIMAP